MSIFSFTIGLKNSKTQYMNGYIEDRGSKGCEHNSTQARFEGDDDDDDSYDFAPAA